MDKLGLPYEEIDLRERPDLVDQFKDRGHMAAPIVTAGDKIWSGFRLTKIQDLAHTFKGEQAHDQHK